MNVLSGLVFVCLLVVILFIIGAYWLIIIGLALIIAIITFVYKKHKKEK